MNNRACTLGLLALLFGGSLSPAAEAPRLPERAATAAPDPAREQLVRGLRARFNLQQSESGLLFRITQPGSGPRARLSDTVTVTLAARLLNGATIPSLSVRESAIKVADLLPGLAEMAQALPIGTKVTLCLLPHLSFGTGPWPKGVRPGSPIFFEAEVHDTAPVTGG